MNYQILLDTFRNLISVDNTDIELIRKLFIPFNASKNTTLIQSGSNVHNAYFIIQGFLHYYKTTIDGNEQTIHLAGPGDFITSLSGFFMQTAVEENLQALTDVQLLIISRPNLERLFNSAPKWQKFGRKLMENYLIEKEQRLIELLSIDAKTRYLKLLETKKELIQNVPVKYIASFLGIHPESLSRIRKLIRKQPIS